LFISDYGLIQEYYIEVMVLKGGKEHQEVLKGGGKKSYEKGRPKLLSGENEFGSFWCSYSVSIE